MLDVVYRLPSKRVLFVGSLPLSTISAYTTREDIHIVVVLTGTGHTLELYLPPRPESIIVIDDLIEKLRVARKMIEKELAKRDGNLSER